MPSRLLVKGPGRLFAALMALCYFGLSAVLSFQHTDGPAHEAEALLAMPGSSVHAVASIPVSTHITACHGAARGTHCLACEWQATNVSPALPALVLAFTPPSTPRVITTFPRTLRLQMLSTSSRAPPLA